MTVRFDAAMDVMVFAPVPSKKEEETPRKSKTETFKNKD
jgi:hypothetical protein